MKGFFGWIGDFIEGHFDKLLLALIVFWLANRATMPGIEEHAAGWAREQASAALGALIGLITGVRLGIAIAERRNNGGGKPPEEGK